MAGKKRKKVREGHPGLEVLDQLLPLLERLHEVGCERDRAGNRQLHFGQYCLLVLVFLFNPVVTSLRGIQQASELKKVQRRLKCPRAALGSLSESVDVFDPQRLKEILKELGEKLPTVTKDSRLADVKHTVTLVDGSLLRVLPWLSQAMLQEPSDAQKVRLHTHFEVDRYVPTRIDVTGGTPRGPDDERALMRKSIEGDRLYVMDRGHAMFKLFHEVVAAGSSYVCRIRDNSSCGTVGRFPLGPQDLEADVLEDRVVAIGSTCRHISWP